ncbi:MAG TPA: hypothetical protein VF319_17565 [Caldimonas sp.]
MTSSKSIGVAQAGHWIVWVVKIDIVKSPSELGQPFAMSQTADTAALKALIESMDLAGAEALR